MQKSFLMALDKYCYEYPRPAVSADMVVFGFDGNNFYLLLIQRGNEPYKDKWALPGGFLEMDETIENCAKRELREETTLKNTTLEQLYTFSSVNRDPRGRVLTVAFWTIIEKDRESVAAGDDAAKAQWYLLNSLPALAFDHVDIVSMAIGKLLSLSQFSLPEIINRFGLQSSVNLNLLMPALKNITIPSN